MSNRVSGEGMEQQAIYGEELMGRISRVGATGPWVAEWPYSRAIRHGDICEVSGTTAIDAAGAVLAHDAYGQAKAIFGIIGDALMQAGASLDDVIRTRVFLARVADWKEVGRAHAETFGTASPPASSCIGGVELLRPELLVEIEATAKVQ